MRNLLLLFSLFCFALGYSQDLPKDYYLRVKESYELDEISRTAELSLSTNFTNRDNYRFKGFTLNIDLFNLNFYRGLKHNYFDLLRSVSFRMTIGATGYVDKRSMKLIDTETFDYKVKESNAAFMPNTQFQLIIRALNPINIKISRGIGYNYQFHNYLILKEHTTFSNTSNNSPKTVSTEDEYSIREKGLEFFTRIGIFVPIIQGGNYIEFGVINQHYFTQKSWNFYISFGLSTL